MNKITLILLPLLFLLGCREDLTDSTDITESSWKVKSLTVNGDRARTPNRDYHGNLIDDSRYVLVFSNDTVYEIRCGINSGAGQYKVLDKGVILINYPGMTEICCDSDFDIQLIESFGKITEYKVLGKYLFMKGNNCEIKFKKCE